MAVKTAKKKIHPKTSALVLCRQKRKCILTKFSLIPTQLNFNIWIKIVMIVF